MKIHSTIISVASATLLFASSSFANTDNPIQTIQDENNQKIYPHRYSVRSENALTITPTTRTIISKWYLEIGSVVEKNETIISFDCIRLEADKDVAYRENVRARDDYKAKKEEYQKGFRSKDELNRSNNTYLIARAKFNAASKILNTCKIKSPFTGELISKKKYEGDTVESGEAAGYVVDTENLIARIRFDAEDTHARTLKKGSIVTLISVQTSKKVDLPITRIGRVNFDDEGQVIEAEILVTPSQGFSYGDTGRISLNSTAAGS